MIKPHCIYSIVVPLYRSKLTISALLKRLSIQMDLIGEEYEIIMVDDGSNDNSYPSLVAMVKKYQRVQLIQLARNFGQHNALMCGFAHSNGDFIITIDDDLQNPPEEIIKLITTAKEGFDVVYGVPFSKKHHFFRNIDSFGIFIKEFLKQQFIPHLLESSTKILLPAF